MWCLLLNAECSGPRRLGWEGRFVAVCWLGPGKLTSVPCWVIRMKRWEHLTSLRVLSGTVRSGRSVGWGRHSCLKGAPCPCAVPAGSGGLCCYWSHFPGDRVVPCPPPHILCRSHGSSEAHLLLECRFPSNCVALCECEAETYLILGNRENHRPLRESICIFVTARELHEQVELSYRFKLHIVSSVQLFSGRRMPVLKRG